MRSPLASLAPAAAVLTLLLPPAAGSAVAPTPGAAASAGRALTPAVGSAAPGGSGAGGVAPPAQAAHPSRTGLRARARWVWPLSPRPAVVRGFEPPPKPWASGHRGADLAGHAGQEVLAAGDGVVSFSGVVAGRGVVTVRHGGGWRTTYEPVLDRLPRGTSVAAGDRLGVLGGGEASHCAPRLCLHWGALTGESDYHDPLLLLGLGRPILLPLPD